MKTILITGSTDGIGKLAAIRLAKDGHHVLLHGRNPQKLQQTIKEVKATSQNDKVVGFVADFSDLNAVHQMAQQIQDSTSSLDVVINNAGIFQSKTRTTKAGLDICLAVNYIAPFVLTDALLPQLKAQKGARVINLSSAAQASVNLDALVGTVTLDTQSSYAQSKLALTMWSFDLAKQEKDLTVIAVNPGSLLNTKMVQEAYGRFWSSADKGSNILYDLALAPEYSATSGLYFDNDLGEEKGDFNTAHEDAYDSQKIAALLAKTREILE